MGKENICQHCVSLLCKAKPWDTILYYICSLIYQLPLLNLETNQPWQTQTHSFSKQHNLFLFLLVITSSLSLSLSLSLSKLQTYCNNVYYNQEPLMSKTKETVGFVESQGKVVKLEVNLSGLTQILLQQIKTCQITLQLHRFAIPFRSLLHQFFLIPLPVISMLLCIYFVYNFKTFWIIIIMFLNLGHSMVSTIMFRIVIKKLNFAINFRIMIEFMVIAGLGSFHSKKEKDFSLFYFSYKYKI